MRNGLGFAGRTRLGLDLGANSIGWCLLKLNERGEPTKIIDMGVRILTPNDEAGRDPRSKASLAAGRREARAARRRRDRFLRRRERLMETLIEAGLMPPDKADRKALAKVDPYWLRASALDQKLPLYEVGRAIFHLNQRRGFKSNRIADAGDSEAGAIKAGSERLSEELIRRGARTLGELLAKRHGRDRKGHRLATTTIEPVRFRPTARGAKHLYEFFPTREMVADELEKIWKAQKQHHPELSDSLLNRLKRIIIEQRPLKKPVIGRCTLRPEAGMEARWGFDIDMGERAPKAHPLFQRFRILSDVANLAIVRPGHGSRPLTGQEAKAVTAKLMAASSGTVDFETLRKSARLPEDARFNQELSGRRGYAPDQTAMKLSAKKAFGKTWRTLSRERQIEVVERLLRVEDPNTLKGWLQASFGLDDQAADAVSSIRLPDGHGQFGRSVLEDLVTVMEQAQSQGSYVDPETGEIKERPMTYDAGVKALGLHHSDLRARGGAPRLPYYGRALTRHVISRADAPEGSQDKIGRVPNPTVHIGLNQVRAVVNALVDAYGPIDEMVIELARELKLNRDRKEEIQRENRENEKRNQDRRARLESIGVADTHHNRLMLRLYDELPADERVCVYTGMNIGSLQGLFSGGIDIDHILPYSATLDDSFMNKVLCVAHANRGKGNRSPAGAWNAAELCKIEERARRLFPKKAWRFQPDAMERFKEDGGFLARHLTDTQHMARLAKAYLEHVCTHVWAPPGRLTSMLRARWGLNDLLPDHNYGNSGRSKSRKDHRHHAIDAFVIACTDRALLQRIARASGRAEELNLDRLFPKDSFPQPFEGHREALDQALRRIVVSHKPDHGIARGKQNDVSATSGKLLDETAYGLVAEEIEGKEYNLVRRKPIAELTRRNINCVRDRGLREALRAVAEEAARDGRKLDQALAAYGDAHGIRRVRCLETKQFVQRVRHGDGFEKAYTPAGNHRVEIFELRDGGWRGEGVTVFDANQPGFVPRWQRDFPGARLVMRVHNGDLVEAEFGERREIYRVCQLEPSASRIRLIAHHEAGSIQERHDDPNDPLRWILAAYTRLKQAGARRVRIDPIGRISAAQDRP